MKRSQQTPMFPDLFNQRYTAIQLQDNSLHPSPRTSAHVTYLPDAPRTYLSAGEH